MFTIDEREKYLVIYSCIEYYIAMRINQLQLRRIARMSLKRIDVQQKEPDTNVHIMSLFIQSMTQANLYF